MNVLAVGVGCTRGATAEEIGRLVDGALEPLDPAAVRCLATVDQKAGEPGIVAVAAARGWRLVSFTPAELAAVAVPTPSQAVQAATGTPSVAEAAALRAALSYGDGAELVVPKRRSAGATVAVARPNGASG